MTYQIRPTTIADVDDLYELICSLAAFEKKDVSSLPITKEKLKKHLFNDPSSFQVELVTHEKKAVGYALYFYTFSAYLCSPILYVEDLFIEPEHQNIGLGTKLLKQLAKYAKEKDCYRMEWHVFDWNQKAIDFYKQLGAVFKPELIQVRLENQALLELQK